MTSDIVSVEIGRSTWQDPAEEAPRRAEPITMTYRNYRGEIAERRIIPEWIGFGATDWHPEPQWLLRAFDTDKHARRDFALADCQFADLCASGQQVRALVDAAQTILDRGYVSQSIAEEKPDHDALRDALAALTPAPQPEGHADDQAVDRFAAAMKAKLAKKRAEGRGGWDRKDECSAEDLTYMLVQHVWKGDPLDVGNLAMMLHQRGERIVLDGEAKSIAPQPEGQAQPEGQVNRIFRAHTMLELNRAIYDAHGWNREAGESMSARLKPLYDFRVDYQANMIVATPRAPAPSAATPTAQEAVPVAWQLKDTKVGTIAYTSNKERANRCRGISGFVVTPMFAHPPQPSETVAEALRELVAACEAYPVNIARADAALDNAHAALRALKGGSNG